MCGATIRKNASTCVSCGEKFPDREDPFTRQSKFVAALLVVASIAWCYVSVTIIIPMGGALLSRNTGAVIITLFPILVSIVFLRLRFIETESEAATRLRIAAKRRSARQRRSNSVAKRNSAQ
jgi:hypothetical protein